MKKLLLLLLVFTATRFIACSQSLIPAAQTFKIEKGKFIGSLIKDTSVLQDARRTAAIISNNFNARFEAANLKNDSDKKSRIEIMRKVQRVYDSVYKAKLDEAYEDMLPTLVNKLDSLPAITPAITAGVSNLENTKQSYGSLALGFQFRLSKYKVGKKGWIDPHFVYLLFSTKTATSPDSSTIQKTFMFPDLNKRDFVMGYYWLLMKKDWSVSPLFEFSLNRFSDTAIKKNFVSTNFLLGIKFQKSFDQDGGITPFISFFPYYSLISVDKKYAVDYKKMIGEEEIPTVFHSLGLQVSCQVTKGILFCNMKYILNKEGDIKSPELKRFIYTIGTMIGL